MVIVHSYVSLPEGNLFNYEFIQIVHRMAHLIIIGAIDGYNIPFMAFHDSTMGIEWDVSWNILWDL